MNPTKEQKTLTSVGMETPTETVARIEATRNQPAVIPVDVVDNPPDQVQVPQVDIDPNVVTSAVASSKSLQDDFAAQTAEFEKQYGSGQDLIRAYNEQLGLRTADRNALEGQAGLPESRQLLNQRLSQIKRKTDQIANRDSMSTLEQGQLEGRGQDSRLVARNQAAIARNRQMERATEAIELRSQIADAELLRGNIDSAVAEIDAALDAKYTPIENALAMEMQFLQDTKDFLTTAQKNEADARIAQYEQEVALINDARAAVSQAVASGGMEPGEAERIMALPPQEQIAAANEVIGRTAASDRALEQQQRQASINASNVQAAKDQIELDLMRQAQADRQAAIERGDLLPEQAEVADDIDKQFRSEPVVKEYNEAVSKRYAVESVLDEGVKGVQDLLLVYEFMKSVDPTSVVRESEFDNAAKTGNIFRGAYTKFNEGYFGAGGFLPPEVKASFRSALDASFEGKTQQYYNVKDEFGQKVNRRLGIENGSNYLTDYEMAAPLTSVEWEVVETLSGATDEDMADIFSRMNSN